MLYSSQINLRSSRMLLGYAPCRTLTGPDFQSVFNLELWASNAKLISYYMIFGYAVLIMDAYILTSFRSAALHGVRFLSMESILRTTTAQR